MAPKAERTVDTSDSWLDDVRRTLYAGEPNTFLERRKELAAAARLAGERDRARLIAGLRKPTAAAHLMNLLAQSDDDTLTELIDLGASIRQAIARGDDQEMRVQLQQRPSALAATLARAKQLARSTGDSVSAAVADQIVQTLRAAMATDEAADQVRRGTLTEALDEPGFAAIGVDPGTPPATRPTKGSATRPTKGSAKGTPSKPNDVADDLRKAEAEAVRVADEAEERLATAADVRVELERTRDDLVAQLAAVDADLTEARAAEEDADRQYRQATATLDEARAARTGG